MKANELMIGDWVLIDGVARKVCAITKHKVGYHLCESESTMHYARLHDVNPIPLTPEIMERNGYRYEPMYGPFYRSILGDYAIDREPTISIGWNGRGEMCEWDISDGKRGASYGRHLLGVHELQHALRLCGLNELADNFKIE